MAQGPDGFVRKGVAAALMGGLLAGGAWAAGDMDKGSDGSATMKQETAAMQAEAGKTSMMRGSEMIGKSVENADGETLGRIEDLVLGADGEVRYLVLSAKEEPAGGMLTAIPWKAAEVTREGTIQVEIAADRFAEAPQFSSDDWPDLAGDSTFATRVDSYYEAPISQKLARERPPAKPQELAAFSVLDRDGDGKISREEAQESDTLNQSFSEVDKDGSGAIDEAEFSAFEETFGQDPLKQDPLEQNGVDELETEQ